ncbi:MAG: c-type cytochrome [Bacteroidetes bacterium]|nr:c-type cytochrome [Bacteroidota bacterium]MCW5894167.1 c-type cytochrome [Bacteroidota bacterium]
MKTLKIIIVAAVLAALFAGCVKVDGVVEPVEETFRLPNFPGFPPVPVPAHNPMSTAKVTLGRHLFFDPRFSRDSSVSCASCHKPEFAFADAGNRTSAGFAGLRGTRNTPGLTNTAYGTSFFWEGGVLTLEIQVVSPILNPVEMNMNTDTLVLRLMQEPRYATLFTKAWGDSRITLERITHSIAAFERTILSGSSPFDKWTRGDRSAISASAARGADLFFGERGDCFHCHGGFNFTDNAFHNTGLDSVTIDPGRYLITNNETDKGRFKTPTLRNIALTSPYMHDGRFTSLEEVVRHYNSGGKPHPNRDILMRPLGLTESEVQDIVAFLEALTDLTFTTNPELQDPWQN